MSEEKNKELTRITNWLKEETLKMKKNNEDMNDASYGYETGLLLTGNEAALIVESLDQLSQAKKDAEEARELLKKIAYTESSYDIVTLLEEAERFLSRTTNPIEETNTKL